MPRRSGSRSTAAKARTSVREAGSKPKVQKKPMVANKAKATRTLQAYKGRSW